MLKIQIYFSASVSVTIYGNGTGASERQWRNELLIRIRMNGNVTLETRHNTSRTACIPKRHSP